VATILRVALAQSHPAAAIIADGHCARAPPSSHCGHTVFPLCGWSLEVSFAGCIHRLLQIKPVEHDMPVIHYVWSRRMSHHPPPLLAIRIAGLPLYPSEDLVSHGTVSIPCVDEQAYHTMQLHGHEHFQELEMRFVVIRTVEKYCTCVVELLRTTK
jgi:hypothetical protein